MDMTPATLREAQLRERQRNIWPESVFISDEQLVAELLRTRQHYSTLDNKPLDWATTVQRYREAHPQAIAYKCGKALQYLGMRYGFDGSQYISF
jgi:hypothetical protein